MANKKHILLNDAGSFISLFFFFRVVVGNGQNQNKNSKTKIIKYKKIMLSLSYYLTSTYHHIKGDDK